ncbi:MAG: response regulator [Alphaproteobacteria bacterium]|nr:response regulator [Alphaproteobacteria bacterium]
MVDRSMLKGLNILVVEDVDAIRALVVRIVESLGADNVHQAMGIETALAELDSRPFDVILLDYELSGRDGLVVIKKLREDLDHFNHETPIIVLTGHSEAHIVQDCMQAGAEGYLVKPVMPDMLGQRILQVLAKHQTVAEETRPPSEVVWGSRG